MAWDIFSESKFMMWEGIKKSPPVVPILLRSSIPLLRTTRTLEEDHVLRWSRGSISSNCFS